MTSTTTFSNSVFAELDYLKTPEFPTENFGDWEFACTWIHHYSWGCDIDGRNLEKHGRSEFGPVCGAGSRHRW